MGKKKPLIQNWLTNVSLSQNNWLFCYQKISSDYQRAYIDSSSFMYNTATVKGFTNYKLYRRSVKNTLGSSEVYIFQEKKYTY